MTRFNLFRAFSIVVFCGWTLLGGTAQATIISTPTQVNVGNSTDSVVVATWTAAEGSSPINASTDLLLNHLSGRTYVGNTETNQPLANINDGAMVGSYATPPNTVGSTGSVAAFTAGGVLTFTLDGKYDINQIDSFTVQQGYRIGQKYTIEFSSDNGGTWGSPTSINYDQQNDASYYLRRIRLTDSTAPVLATGVDAIRFTFADPFIGAPYNYNLYACYAEIAAYGTATPAAPSPEPSTLVLLGCGVVGLLAYAWRRRIAPVKNLG